MYMYWYHIINKNENKIILQLIIIIIIKDNKR